MKSTHWRAIVKLPDGREFQAWVKQVSSKKIVIRNEVPLREGSECGLTMNVPQSDGAQPEIVQANCRASKSILSSMEFRTWLDLLELKGGATWMQG